MSKTSPRRYVDRATLAGMAAGLGVLLMPGFEGALKAGFFVTLAATVAQIVVGHLPARLPAKKSE